MRRMMFLASVALAIGVLIPSGAFPAVGGSDLPLKGSFAGTSTHVLATGQVHAVSTGELTHFGLATLVQDATLNLSTLAWSGTWTLTAANGDEMWGTSVGSGTRIDPTHIQFGIDYSSTGGTGRFADANASFTVTLNHARVGLVNGVSYGEHTATLDGELSW